MDNTRRQRMAQAVLGVVFLLVCDRILKYWALQGLYHTKIDLIRGWLTFELFENKAIAFSIPLPQFVIVPLAAVVITLLAVLLFHRARHGWQRFESGLLLLVTGAASNLYDRLQYGFVVDYINFVYWPVFNIADVMIAAGVLLTGWQLLRRR